jgi:hypothetical protein
VSATRPPASFPAREHQLDQLEELDEVEELDPLEDLEELGDEAIIAQQTAAHALKPRANVSEESRSVVITEHPAREGAELSGNLPAKSSAEATVVIRDRRALDEMRQKIVRRQQQKAKQAHSAFFLWGALGLAAFVLGGIVAYLATDMHSDSQSASGQAPAGRADGQMQGPTAPRASAPPKTAPHAVRLDDLPVESARKH